MRLCCLLQTLKIAQGQTTWSREMETHYTLWLCGQERWQNGMHEDARETFISFKLNTQFGRICVFFIAPSIVDVKPIYIYRIYVCVFSRAQDLNAYTHCNIIFTKRITKIYIPSLGTFILEVRSVGICSLRKFQWCQPSLSVTAMIMDHIWSPQVLPLTERNMFHSCSVLMLPMSCVQELYSLYRRLCASLQWLHDEGLSLHEALGWSVEKVVILPQWIRT
jgi:hypothetical protein